MNYQPAPAQPRWNTVAIIGFVLSFFLGLIGSIVSIIGFVQAGKNGERGRGLAIAGIVIGLLGTILYIIGGLLDLIFSASQSL